MTLAARLRLAAAGDPMQEAYVCRGRRLTYGEWQRLAERVGANLVTLGLGRGDRVAVVLPPRPEWGVIYAGAAAAGFVTAGVNPRLGKAEIEHVVGDCGARVAVTIDRFGERDLGGFVAGLRARLPDLAQVFVVRTSELELPERAGDSGDAPADSFRRLLVEPPRESLERLREIGDALGPDDPVALVYTSGTTGKPKGALFLNRNLEAVARTRHEMGTRRGDRLLTAGTPFAHIGYMTKILGHVEDRQTIVILDAFDARAVLETVARERITHLGGVPTQWTLMLRVPDFDGFDLSSLRGGAIGGAPFTPELVREIRRRFGIALTTRYACTEIGLGTGSRPDDPEELLAETVGRPGEGVEVRIVDEARRPLRPGEIGEVAVRGPAVMAGYWNRPDETREALDAEGWFHTGDLGFLGEDGYLRLRGRKKELYIRGGYNVVPVEVEAVLAEHPDVAQAAVVGVPDPVLGEKGLAVIVARDPARPPDAEGLRAWCRERLADYKIPDFFELRTEIPLTAMYKTDKARLRDEFGHEPAPSGKGR